MLSCWQYRVWMLVLVMAVSMASASSSFAQYAAPSPYATGPLPPTFGGVTLAEPMGFDPYSNVAPAAGTTWFDWIPAPPTIATMDCCTERPTRFRLFTDYLYLRPGDSDRISFALPVNGAIIPLPDPSVPVGAVASVKPGYQPGFRVGLGLRPNPCNEWALVYTRFEGDDALSVGVDPTGPVVLRSLVIHPATVAADTAFLNASANHNIDFDLADFEYRQLFKNCRGVAALVFGARYARLNQAFNSTFTNTTTIETVATDIDFDGGGLRTGLESEWYGRKSRGFSVYGRGYASLLAGQFTSSYAQTDNFAGLVVATADQDDRIVPILDLELGAGWQSPRGCLYLSAGYQFSAWYNVVSTTDFLRDVQSVTFDGDSDTLSFDGLVARAEFRY